MEEWGAIFHKNGVDSACFELLDHNHEQIYLWNLNRCGKQVSPASTFKVMLSLMALETNVALDENLVIPWNGVSTGRTEWDKDMNMREALKVSSEPYYRELAKRIGKPELQKWLDTLRYGNKKIGDSVERCWTDQSLQISPDEQLTLMKRLYFNKLPFSERAQRIVRSMMLQEDTPDYKLYYKTGTLPYANKKGYLLWIVGFLERKETSKNIETKLMETNFKPYFFSLNMEVNSEDQVNPAYRVDLLKQLLQSKGIMGSK